MVLFSYSRLWRPHELRWAKESRNITQRTGDKSGKYFLFVAAAIPDKEDVNKLYLCVYTILFSINGRG